MKSATLDPSLVRAASEWFARLRESPVEPEDIAAWLEWYESDERHKRAFDDVRSFWEQSGALAEQPDFLRSVLREAAADYAPRPMQRMRDWLRPSHYVSAAIALAAIVAMLGLLRAGPVDVVEQPVVTLNGPDAFPEPDKAEAPVPAPREMQKAAYLSDGSQVALAEKSAVSVRYTKTQRLLELESGVAFFQVAHNARRPFIVKAGDFCVRAIGTAFNVRKTGTRVVVTVTDGAVDVYPEGASRDSAVPASGAVRAEAGKEVVWASRGAKPTVEAVDVSHALAWRKGMLEYLNEPLGAAIQDINRYSRRKVVIRDPAVEQIRFSGTVFTSSTDAWLQALPNLFPVSVAVDGAGDLVLSSRP